MSLDKLWEVAKGQKKYAEFARQRKDGDAAPPPPPTPEQEVELPADVVSHKPLLLSAATCIFAVTCI